MAFEHQGQVAPYGALVGAPDEFVANRAACLWVTRGNENFNGLADEFVVSTAGQYPEALIHVANHAVLVDDDELVGQHLEQVVPSKRVIVEAVHETLDVSPFVRAKFNGCCANRKGIMTETTRKLFRHPDWGTGRIVAATVSEYSGKWKVSFTVEVPITREPERVIGVDFGVSTLCTGVTPEGTQVLELALRQRGRPDDGTWGVVRPNAIRMETFLVYSVAP